MKSLLSYVLLGAGGLCVGMAGFTVIRAETHQSEVVRQWTEPSFNSANTKLLLPPGAVARLRFERQNRDVFVWGDEKSDHWAKGPVWLRVTRSFASTGNTVVAGHRDTHFRFLKDAKVGDVFEVNQEASHLTFRISMMRIVSPTDRSLLAPTAEKTVTLVTCYPFYMVGRASHRMIIRAELIQQ
jgi:LPXTG-site transpeptidase (sortase) family protein